jgi:hypothetical protein
MLLTLLLPALVPHNTCVRHVVACAKLARVRNARFVVLAALQAAALSEAAGPGPGSAAIAAATAAARGPGRMLLPQLGWGLVSPAEGLLQPGWVWLLAPGGCCCDALTDIFDACSKASPCTAQCWPSKLSP